jgi:hypothetical protein
MELTAPFNGMATGLLNALTDGPAAVDAWLKRLESTDEIRARPPKLHKLA